MTPEDLKRKVDDLIRRTDAFNKKKASVGGQIEAKKGRACCSRPRDTSRRGLIRRTSPLRGTRLSKT